MKREKGFTLIELMISVAISGLVLTSIHTFYSSQTKSYVSQEQVATIQQNLRGGMFCMQREIRMAGYDPSVSGNFGITDVRLDSKGNGSIALTLDDNLNDENNESDGNGQVDVKETIMYSLYDYPTAAPDGILDLGRKYGATRRLLAENIEAMGIAYAFDTAGDGDNLLDTDRKGNVIWAIDSDGDNDLDMNLDEDNNGNIDIDDDTAGKALRHVDNGERADILLSDIRAVRIWLLARDNRGDSDYVNNQTFVVADQRLSPKDGHRRRLLTTIIRCRNLEVLSNN